MIANPIRGEHEGDDWGAFLSSDFGEPSYVGPCRDPELGEGARTALGGHHCLNS